MAADSVHCCVTSPPYWGLRDYGVDGQIGLEASPAEFIAVMVDVLEEMRCVLRPDGTCWINMGDSYATAAGRVGNHPGGGAQGQVWRGVREGHEEKQAYSVGTRGTGTLTQPNRMPRQGLKPKDLVMMPYRLAIALQDAGWWVRQDIVWSKPNPMPESVRDRCTKSHEYLFLLSENEKYFYDAEAIKEPAAGARDHPRNSFGTKDYDVPGQKPQKRTARGVGFGHGTDADARQRGRVMACSKDDGRDEEGLRTAARMGGGTGFREDPAVRPDMRNKRSVWTMATHSFAEAHFATFPPELPENCIRAGCPPGGVVLDPFFGAGTTGLVADRLQRDCIGIELNPAYAEIARKRKAA
ncbi:DNA-methyltransferase [Janthinobacterium sp. ROICE36]|uniref:DNA-methyltransferase n=1 Tax=Janthinobacterium sp. ROICE36 TaxID=2048670 RepID=UPI0011AF615C|nr:site-specific DNA-methyltransferase [Janthinobacterium sp. ROICE36]